MSTSFQSRGLNTSALIGLVCLIAVLGTPANALQTEPTLPDGTISGTLRSSNGPEAGVWVIAETEDLLTPFIKIVVTDDNGRFLLPELPDATYNVWVRGYGLVDSTPMEVELDDTELFLQASLASSPQEAARVYPGNYWYSLIEPPSEDEFPGTGPDGNGISTNMQSQGQWIDNMKQGCQLCHQLGTQITRQLSHMDHLNFESSFEAWDYRVQTGVRGNGMSGVMNRYGRERALEMLANWTDRIAAGEVPEAPPRPSGVERNLVITMWDWGVETSFIHDEIATAKSDPTINGFGPVYGASAGHGKLTVVDPIENSVYELTIPTRDDPATVPSRFPAPTTPSNFYGDEHLWGNPPENPADPHNPMLDSKGRVWLTSTVRDRPNPDWCLEGSANPYARYFPVAQSRRQTSYYDAATNEFVLVNTGYGTHHLQFGEDENEMLYFSGGGPVIGWRNTRMFDETGDEQLSQGWCPTVLDTNGDGRITRPWNEPMRGIVRNQEQGGGGGQLGEFDPGRDTRVNMGSYGIIVNPVDNSVWAANTAFPGHLLRFVPGENPPETCAAEIYRVPQSESGYGPRGIDVDRNGIIWTALSGSSHLASFDRSKCSVLNGPEAANGTHCDEGWTLYQTEGPRLKGTDVPADFHYYGWVDQFNTLGLGDNVPIATGSGSDSMLALLPETGEWVTLRVPYPLGFFSRGVDGRIDDPDAGWKGRGLWANYGSNYIWHTEGGKGTTSKIVHFQLRPDPLAR